MTGGLKTVLSCIFPAQAEYLCWDHAARTTGENLRYNLILGLKILQYLK